MEDVNKSMKHILYWVDPFEPQTYFYQQRTFVKIWRIVIFVAFRDNHIS